MAIINFKEEDIKECKIALANQKLTPLQSAFLMQYIINLEEQLEQSEKARKDAIEELYVWGEVLIPKFQQKMLNILDIDKGE